MKTILKIFFFTLFIGCGNSDKRREINYELDSSNRASDLKSSKEVENQFSENVLFMEQENGVRYVWVEVNGIKLRFIFDTGASSLCISTSEASVLYRQGTLSQDDFIGVENFQDATGKISEGVKVNLRKVKVGNNILENVEATVINNENAPLLLGQSVLERFGKIEIDNENNKIVFK
jgi:aspartyl protease family protein